MQLPWGRRSGAQLLHARRASESWMRVAVLAEIMPSIEASAVSPIGRPSSTCAITFYLARGDRSFEALHCDGFYIMLRWFASLQRTSALAPLV